MYTGFYMVVVKQRLISLCGHLNRIFATARVNRMTKKPVAILYSSVSSFFQQLDMNIIITTVLQMYTFYKQIMNNKVYVIKLNEMF